MPHPVEHNPNNTKPTRPPWLALFACATLTTALTVLILRPIPPHADERPVLTPVAWFGEPEPGDTKPEPTPGMEQGNAQSDTQSDTRDDEGMKECVITLRTGRTITGELVYQDSRVVIVGIDGIDTTFQRRNVADVIVLAPVAERYKQLRATIADTDIDARLALVEWLRARRAYTLALKELDSILLLDPANPQAKILHTWLSAYSKLKPSEKPEENRPAERGEQEPDREYKIQRNALPTLTDEQLNQMRVYEIDLRNPPKLRVPDDVLLELMRRYPDHFSPNEDEREKILQLPEVEKLKLLFTLRARDLYSKVEVLENPESLQRFKDQVHAGRGWLINACASTRCHGGVDAGSFQLINQRPNTDATAFTNLYIIEHTKLANGQPLIDYKNPDRSPLLQMGMIRSNSLVPHPELPRGYPGTGYRSIFRSTRDRKYQQAVEWIRSMYQPRPDIEFDYPPTPTPPSDASAKDQSDTSDGPTQPKPDHKEP